MTGLIHCGDLRASLVEIIIMISIAIGNGSNGVIPDTVPIVWIKDGVTKDNANDSCYDPLRPKSKCNIIPVRSIYENLQNSFKMINNKAT